MISDQQTAVNEPGPIALIAALQEEVSYIARILEGRCRMQDPGGSWESGSLEGRPIILARSGIGHQAARACADRIIGDGKPSCVIALGFGGGLQEALRPGDLVIAAEVHDPPPPDGEGPRIWEADGGLLSAAWRAAGERLLPSGGAGAGGIAGQRIFSGRISTTRAMLHSPAAKRAFADRHGALAVDMESSGACRSANVHGTPILCLRAVVDDVDFEMPPEIAGLLTPEGQVRPFAALGTFLRKPSIAAVLPELRRRSKAAGEALARFLRLLVPLLPMGPAPSPHQASSADRAHHGNRG